METYCNVARTAVLCVLLSLAANTLFADKVILTNGREIQCTIRKETATKVEIEVDGNRLTLPRSRIKTIEHADAATNAIARGDRLFGRGQYDEAIRAYEQARATKPKVVEAKIKAARTAIQQARESALANLPPAEAEKRIRRELSNPDLSAEEKSALKTRLAGILMKRAELAELEREHAVSTRYLEEAWQTAPQTPGLAPAMIEALIRRDRDASSVVRLFKPYLAAHPDDIETREIFVKEVWKSKPWEALKIVYPGNKLNPKATPAMKSLLPDILLACYKSSAYPLDAQLNREECRRHLLVLKPDALVNEERTTEPAGEGMLVPQEMLDMLLELKRTDGRDNAMIHYVSAAGLMPEVELSWHNLLDNVLQNGWTQRANSLLPVLQQFQQGLAAVRRGAAVDYARNTGWQRGYMAPVPNYRSADVSAKLMCAEGRYFETQGKLNEALDNYLTVLKMGRDYGAPEAILIGGVMCVLIQATALEQIQRLAAAGRLDRAALDRAQKRLMAIERSQPSMIDCFRTQANLERATYRIVRKEPDRARESVEGIGGAKALPVDAIVRSGDRIEADSMKIFQTMIRHLQVSYWERDHTALEHELKSVVESSHWVLQKTVPRHLEADVRYRVTQAKLRNAIITTALELHKKDKGKYPQKLAELVPTYLEEVPTDPFSGEEFKYMPSADGSGGRSYSVGPDMKDDRTMSRYDPKQGSFSGGDIF